jgi:hypothetical protein
LGATKIEDLAGELKNSTFFSVAPPSLILCANQLDISLTLVPGCDSSGLQVQVKEKFSSLNYAICQWAELNIIHTGQITQKEKSHAKYTECTFL